MMTIIILITTARAQSAQTSTYPHVIHHNNWWGSSCITWHHITRTAQ